MAESALQGQLVVLFGGSGFVGRHLAQHLLARGARLRIACRHPERAFAVKPLGNLGTVQFVACDMAKPHTVAAALAGADAAVNLVGAFAGALDAVQGRGLAALAGAAGEAGLKALVHISAIGADADSEIAYARTKAEGEAAVLGAFPGATVLRPSVIFGPDDQFLNMFGGLAAMPVLPVFGPAARFQPVFVDDVAEAVAAALADPACHGGKTYELAGPEVLTMLELNRRVATAAGRQPLLAPLPDAVSGLFAALTGWLPGAPLSRAQWKLLKAGNVASGALPGLKDLGVQPRPMGLFLDRWMTRFRAHGRFGKKASA
ncbi:MAG: NAD(P)H-binding protein [Proteobacteria bacterium]|nr:NAD(P)H-binding protein [Pseudomonadota bacterium]